MGIRVVVVDDNPHVSWQGRVYPVNATFHRFLSAVLDVPGAPVASIVHAVPLRPATEAPRTLPLDERLEVVGTSPFDGIAGFLRRAPAITRRNTPILRAALAGADLLWLKVPASNALLAAWLAGRAGVPRFGYVAGSARDVARGRGLGLPAQALGFAYDLAGRVAGGRQRIVVGAGLIDGDGIVTSLIEADEIRDLRGAPWPADESRLRLAWAGRLASGKGLEMLLDALARLIAKEAGQRVELVIFGDGPARESLEARAAGLGIRDRIQLRGYVADRQNYLDGLAACDLFVFPSPAEGFPKVILDAMAIGLPVVATPTGQITALGASRFEPIRPYNAAAVVGSIENLMVDPDRVKGIRTAAGLFATLHTSPAEAARLVARWRRDSPSLPWPDRG